MNGDGKSLEALIVVARAVKTRGLKGEILADLLTDFPERFDVTNRLICVAARGERKEVELENHWFHKDRVVLKLVGIDDIDAAEPFVGCEFAVPESERIQLPEGQFYDWELEGCVVRTVSGQKVGEVKAVLRTGGVDTLVIEDERRHDYLVPLAETIVVELDIDSKVITIDPPEGLLEL